MPSVLARGGTVLALWRKRGRGQQDWEAVAMALGGHSAPLTRPDAFPVLPNDIV